MQIIFEDFIFFSPGAYFLPLTLKKKESGVGEESEWEWP